MVVGELVDDQERNLRGFVFLIFCASNVLSLLFIIFFVLQLVAGRRRPLVVDHQRSSTTSDRKVPETKGRTTDELVGDFVARRHLILKKKQSYNVEKASDPKQD